MIWMLQVETYLWAHTAPSSVWKGACDEAVPLAPGPQAPQVVSTCPRKQHLGHVIDLQDSGPSRRRQGRENAVCSLTLSPLGVLPPHLKDTPCTSAAPFRQG